MTDYRHDLLFGIFSTPSAADPAQVVASARLAEQVGLDLVTFQDHPYQPSFLDTWTLLAWVAAQTHTITVAPNVVNLPLRPPAVLSRSAASLDLLSGGRLELGLGTGAFWDGIAAMGGARLAPGEAVQALEEAIEIIRGVWDVETRGGVRVDGASTGWKERSADRRRPTTSGSGSGRTSHGCCVWSDTRPTDGSRRWATSSRET